MKILIIAHEYYPKGSGIANLVYEIKKSLEKDGHEIKVASPYGPDHIVGSVKLIHKSGAFGILHFWRKVAYFINKTEGYDLIWLHNPLITKRLNKRNVVMTVHTTYFGCYNAYIRQTRDYVRKLYYQIIMPVEKLSYSKYMKNIRKTVTSRETINELTKIGVDVEHIPIIPNGVNFPEKIEIKSGKIPRCVYVGRFDYQKNLDVMISVFNKVSDNNSAVLDMYGDGDQYSSISKQLSKQKTNITLKGRQPFDYIMNSYWSYDYIFLASDYEGFPMTLVEALSRGCIPILSPIPVFHDVVAHLGEGLIVDFRKPDAATKISVYMKKIAPQKNKVRQRIIEKAKKLYSWQLLTKKYLKVFNDV